MNRLGKTQIIIKIILLLGMILLLAGCGSSNLKPKPYNDSKKKEKEKIKLFNQEFEMPSSSTTATVKLYPATQLKGKKGDSWYDWDSINRTTNNQTYYFSETTSKRFPMPYFAVKFKSPMIISAILIYRDEVAYNDKGNKITLNPNLYLVKDKKSNKSMDWGAPYSKTNQYHHNKVTENVDMSNNIKYDHLNYWSKKPLKNIYIAIDDLSGIQSTKYIDLKKNPTIKVEGYSIQGVVISALKTRTDKDYNEELVREVGFKDTKLFRSIQKDAKNLNLPKSSIAHLPKDVNIKYALKNHAKIIKTERYLATNGKYKSFKTKAIFDSSYKYNPNHKIKVTGKKATMKKTKSSHQTADYIDFSQGI